MKKSIAEAPPQTQNQYLEIRRDLDEMSAIEFAVDAGFMPERPATPAHEKLKDAIERDDFNAIIRIRQSLSWQILQEQRAMTRWNGLARWAKGPSPTEEQAERNAKREKLELEEKIAARALQIVQEDAERIVLKARERARKEIEQSR